MKIPVTVLSGYLGSGKTTLLQHILHQKEHLKIAVIVNDMSEVNIDSQMIKKHGVIRSEEKLVELQNGCICCTLREDLLLEVEKLMDEDYFDYIVIESSGISEPIPVAQTFTYMDEELGVDLSKKCRLDTMVTVVDAEHFWEHYSSGDSLIERNQAVSEEDEREVVDLLVDQIEFANVILLNKAEMIDKASLQLLKSFMRKLNAEAEIIDTTYSQVPLEKF
ncbi:GTPase [Bacillus sp. TS-2]|nr:GTPase [Bacillus sp. TS-2]